MRLDPGCALQAVVAHAGHHHAEQPVAIYFGGRTEEHIHGRPMGRIERPRLQMRHNLVIFVAYQAEMTAGLGEEHRPRLHGVPFMGFDHAQLGQLVQLSGK